MLQIDLQSRKSIYEQIIDGFKELIISGILQPDSKLPSVRELSSQLTVNPNTVQKAYKSLEAQGWIYTSSGLGCFVKERVPSALDEAAVSELLDQIQSICRQLSYLGMSDSEIRQSLLSIELEGGGKNDRN